MIEVWTSESLAQAPGVGTELFRLRHDVFCDELNWVPGSPDGMERDEYDRFLLNPIYLLSKNGACELTGSVRLLPTTASYMLKDTFGHLWSGQQVVNDPCIWEASRFATSVRLPQRRRPQVAALLLQGMCEFGLAYGLDEYLVVVTPSMNTLVTKLGAITKIIGSSADQSGQLILAVRCEVSRNVLDRLRDSTGILYVTTDRQREGLDDVYAA